MTARWVVRLNEAHGKFMYGPFDDEAEASRFASYLSAEVDPAEVLPLRSPTAELLSFWHNHRTDETATLPRPAEWPPQAGDVWEDRNGDRWICTRSPGTAPYLTCLAQQADDSAEEIWRVHGPMKRHTFIPPNVEEPPF